MAAPVVSDRVLVTAQNSNYRGLRGTVLSVDDDYLHVRIDGHPVDATVRFTANQLRTTSVESGIEYPE